LDISRYLGNIWGQFGREGVYFHNSARDARLEGSIIHARLVDGKGNGCNSSVDLDERIASEDGHLKFCRRLTWRTIHFVLAMCSETARFFLHDGLNPVAVEGSS
jgi:hypothetical protein